MNDQQEHEEKALKAVRLVDYLSKLATLRTNLIRDIANYEKVLWLSNVPHERECFTQAWGRDEEHEQDEWLEIQNRQEPDLPAIPPSCRDWVNLPSLRNKDDLPELFPEITRQIQNPDWQEGSDHPETINQNERLEDHPEVQRAWETYIEDKWLPWTELHNTWKSINKVYSILFAIHQEQRRLGEEYELVLGLGLLTWQTPTGHRVRRHLIVADATLEFEARLSKFTVRPHTEGTKLRPELDMLDIEEQPAHAEETAKSSLANAEDDPWERGCLEGVLQSLVHSIDSQGAYHGSLESKNTQASAKPIVEWAPALILRKRSTKGLAETLKHIKTQIEQDGLIPDEFADLAEIRSKDDVAATGEPAEANAAFEGEVFFPKPANEEQRRIVDKIRTANGVLVQGPPGTGKSHTIANLICHLLATGQRTLITAKTPRALQVLERLVPDELRPLCINLLGNGLEERRSLASSVGGILRKSEDWNEDRAKQEQAELEDRLRQLREEKATVDQRLRNIRESETHTQSVAEGAYRGTAARIAEAVNRDRADYEWFTDSVPLDKACPISTNDLQVVLTALRQITPERRRELGLKWPEIELSSEDFANLVRSEERATKEEQDAAREADERFTVLLAKNDPSVVKTIRNTFSSFRDAYSRLHTVSHSWMSDALRDVLAGDPALWNQLQGVTSEVIALIGKLALTADETRVEFPEATDIRSLHDDAREIKEHLENGGRLGWGVFRHKLVRERLYVINEVKVDGRPCSTVEDFSKLIDVLFVRIQCDKAWEFWKGRNEKTEGPYVLQLSGLKSLHNKLEAILALECNIRECRDAINQYSAISVPAWDNVAQIEKIILSCRLALARINKRVATHKIQAVESPISNMCAAGNTHPITHELFAAIRSRDVDTFSRCVTAIHGLEKQRLYLQKIDIYLTKIGQLLPDLRASLEQTYNEQYWEKRVQHIGEAWHWAQARYWVEEYIRQEDAPALASRAKQIEDEISKIIAQFAALHAWSFCFSRLKQDHRRHMEAWQQAIRRLGKGTGKHAPRHRSEAQRHLNECREAVPAWVMPLHRVWDTVSPAPGVFDVVIVDEASQCGFEALPLFYLAKKIVIVGDDKQISPDAVGLPRDTVQRLMQELLYDFQFKSSFDVESSLFDHGKLRYGTQRITLREHFRCMPEIIRFSNDLCYSDTPLIPLRQYGRERIPPLEHVFVDGGYREGSNNRTINRPEAEKIVDRIAEMCADDKYSDKTIGVIVLQGEAQASLIETQLLKRIGAEEMENRRLVCGNSYSFQGDERDIIFLSLVAASNKRIGPFTRAADERRFNVAASRARDQMILFHSVTCDDLSVNDLRRRLLESFQNTRPQQIAGIEHEELERRAVYDNRQVISPPTPFDSWFEVDVGLELLRKGYTVLPQYEVAGKRIDLVVEGGGARLAIECDGDHWHGADRYEDDTQRQRQLERCGWEFFRVRESAFYANKKSAFAGLWPTLDALGIHPLRQNQPADGRTKNEIGGQGNGGSDYQKNKTEERTLNPTPPSDDNFLSRVETVTNREIRRAIMEVLKECPNYSCTLDSLTRRVLSHIQIRTRGKPRQKFGKRVDRQAVQLDADGLIEKYKATNIRVRLTKAGLTNQFSECS